MDVAIPECPKCKSVNVRRLGEFIFWFPVWVCCDCRCEWDAIDMQEADDTGVTLTEYLGLGH